MFFLALAMTFAVFSGIGFTNLVPAWVRVLKDDWGSDLAVVVTRSEGEIPNWS